MKESVLDVLMYLFENYYLDEEIEGRPDRESLQVELLEAGFPPSEVNKAFDWMDGLASQRAGVPIKPAVHSIRLYTDREMEFLDLESRGFLMFLEQMGILTPTSRELAIDRVLALDANDMDIEQQGIPAAKFDRIRAPVGIDIGAQTPAEIGVCIMAEIINVVRSGPAIALSEQIRNERAARRERADRGDIAA